LIARGLDVLGALAVAAGLVVAATGGGTFRGILLTRPEAFVVAATVLFGVRALVKPYAVRGRSPAVTVAVAMVTYVVAMGFIVITRHLALRTHALDLGPRSQRRQPVADVPARHRLLAARRRTARQPDDEDDAVGNEAGAEHHRLFAGRLRGRALPALNRQKFAAETPTELHSE
jgi:hypothetical protein